MDVDEKTLGKEFVKTETGLSVPKGSIVDVPKSPPKKKPKRGWEIQKEFGFCKKCKYKKLCNRKLRRRCRAMKKTGH